MISKEQGRVLCEPTCFAAWAQLTTVFGSLALRLQRGSMTKQMKAAMAAMLMVGTISMQAQLTTTTKTTKPAPGETKTTVITKDNDAAAGTAAKRTGKKHAAAKGKGRKTTKPVESAMSRQLRELREKQVAQQSQIDALTQANAAKDAALAQAQTAAQTAETDAQAATAQAQGVTTNVQANTDAVQALKSNVTDLQGVNSGLAQTISANKVELTDKIESPSVLHYKGVTITPVAFFALEGVYRQRSLNSDINTPFNATPFSGANEAHVSEFNLTGRQTRLGGLFEGNAGPYKLSGYFESDFLSAGTTSNANQSNSYTFRTRQAWGKIETKSGFAVTGGQTWSLLTETGKSTDVRTEKLPNTVDSNYVVGYTWLRLPTIRIQQKIGNPIFGNAVTLAASLEQAQTVNFSATNAPTNFFFGGPGQAGGLYNPLANYSNNAAPDVIVKIATDTAHSHFEVAGIGRFFRDRVYPGIAQPAQNRPGVPFGPPSNDTKFGGGGYLAGRISLNKYVDVAATGMVGTGIGRYASAQLPDVTVRPNGNLEPIRSAHGLASLETHPMPKLDVYAYYGGEYAQRTVYATGVAATPFTGYGVSTVNDTGCSKELTPNNASGLGGSPSAANCNANTRYIQEGVFGFTYRLVNNPKYGRLQYQATYSYLARAAWPGATAGTVVGGIVPAPTALGAPRATNNMFHAGMRYYIP